MRELSIYIHIPFCVRKCAYCDFLSFACENLEIISSDYVEDLCTEIQDFAKAYADQYRVVSIFLGGGTPSVLQPFLIQKILKTVHSNFSVKDSAEISMECNPGTVDASKLKAIHEAGVNRLSIGLQSTHDEELKRLGRIHSFSDFLSTYEGAMKAGFTNINVDLMSAIPGQNLASFKKNLKTVAMLKPTHISAYSLILEEGTPLFEAYENGEDLNLVNEDEEREMYALAKTELEKFGYHRYEISNYAKEGYECQHNLVYWKRGEYVGFGLGAASLLRMSSLPMQDGFRDTRLKNGTDLKLYHQSCRRWKHPECFASPEDELSKLYFESVESLNANGCMEEFMFLGLRCMKGIKKSDFRLQFGKQMEHVYGNVIEKYVRSGHLIEEEDCIRLSEEGIHVSNVILSEFLLSE